jgi:hypothetical protein
MLVDKGTDPLTKEELKQIYYLEYSRKYRLENRDKYNEYQKLYRRKQLEDPEFRLKNKISHKQWRDNKKKFNCFNDDKPNINQLFE